MVKTKKIKKLNHKHGHPSLPPQKEKGCALMGAY
jgi:hypothetical protein